MEERIRAFAELAAAREKDPGGTEVPPVIAPWMSSFSSPVHSLEEQARKGHAHPLVRPLEEREALKKRLEDLRLAPVAIARAWSPMTPHLRRVKAACDARGARLLVVALPLDLQVSPVEWAKYGEGIPFDMAETRVLIDDLVASAEGVGALGLDATPALAAAEPGAFLDGDIHLTPKGRGLRKKLVQKAKELVERTQRGISDKDLATTRESMMQMFLNLTQG